MRQRLTDCVKIKICGITNLKDALTAVKAGADVLGFIFAKSPRRIEVKNAAKIVSNIPLFVTTVGVFVNSPKKEVLSILKKCKLDVLQFHGEETDNYCAFFKKYCKIIKVIRINDSQSIKEIKKYKNVDAFLFDKYKKVIYGGSGENFDWKLLKNIKTKVPIIVSGGIKADNVELLFKQFFPYGIDLCSGVESKPGKKNAKLLREIISLIKNTNAKLVKH